MSNILNLGFFDDFFNQSFFIQINELLDTYFGISITYKYLFLLYVGFILIVILVNLVTSFINLFLKYRVRRLESKLLKLGLNG